ncbi:MAG TPA: carboxymuconolactone decarboxylase family protein [Planctomycetota bacterium]|nr:carboxymuconolactone decarboxylase family protein [Planctomycetota bacterium]
MKREALVGLARVCARAARGAEGPLLAELRKALRSKVPPTLLREALLQTYLFAGFPRAITALTLLDREVPSAGTLREKPKTSAEWRRRGIRLCRAVYGSDFPALMRNMTRAHADLADWILVEGYGKTLSRPFLSLRERELIVVPTLAALGAWRQLPSHLKGALRAGASAREVAEVLRGSRGAVPPAAVRRALGQVEPSRRRIVR